ncbi:MAG: DNA-directed RNA polymerase I subunit rpa49 [Geoglossum simile]|nr:MAG: DNA-directed RNA polymerase I subunit rpa49 [Geoglossum simile]
MTERKRKRESGKHERSSKKTATGVPPMVRISMMPDIGDWCPVIASMPGLALPRATSFMSFQRPRTSNRHNPSSSLDSSELLLNSSIHPKVDYTGREEIAADSLLKHYVGVYDPAVGELQVIEARKLVIRGTLRDEVTSETELDEEGKQTTRSLRNELGLAFGTKKARKVIASFTENAISSSKPTGPSSGDANATPVIDSVATAVLESMAPSANTMASREDLQKDIDSNKPRPKANLSATSPEGVYPIDYLVGQEEMKALSVKEWEDAVTEGKEITSKSRYVCRRVQKIGEARDVQKLKVLRYLQLLLDFYFSLGKVSKDGRKLPRREELREALGVPDFLVERVRKRFADGGQPMIKWRVDNLITHIAALALVVDGFEVDIYDLKEDLRLETKEAALYFQEVGCRVLPLTDRERDRMGKLTKAEASSHKMAKLRVPVEYPKPRRVRTRR